MYSKGGWGVAVGMSVAGRVAVGGMVAVGVSVGVPVISGDNAFGSFGTAKNVTAAATMMTVASTPNAAGRLRRISGIRLACTDFSAFLATFGAGWALNSVPHTRQRVAFSLKRVPQVGQTLVLLLEVGSGVIRAGIIPLNNYMTLMHSTTPFAVLAWW